jgi:Zn-finger nucleic acid-binding protein
MKKTKNNKIAQKKEKEMVVDIVVNKKCPICKVPLSSSMLSGVEVDFCPKCLGLWFEEEELRLAKDEKDKNLQWLDVDLWKNEKEFKISYGIRICPSCRMPLYEVYYGRSGIIVDVCNLCRGIWLDRGEFKKIVEWLKEKADYEVLHNYAKNLFEEAREIFSGPETLREEVLDFLAIIKLLNYKFAAKHPAITKIISSLPR